MPDYVAFGGRLRSDLRFPWLRPAPPDPAAATWTLASGVVATPQSGSDLIGEDEIGDGSSVRLYREPDRHVIVYDGLATFELRADRITWCAEPGVPAELIRLCVIGRVFASVLHLSGALCLHGGAVELGGRGLAFLAPPGTGKSTLVRALVASGARLAADDSIPVEAGEPSLMRPGIAAMRIGSVRDRAAAEGPERSEEDADEVEGEIIETRIEPTASEHPLVAAATAKRFVVPPAERAFGEGMIPLGAVYLLSPVAAGAEPAARRERLSGAQAMVSLLGNARSGGLAAQSWVPALLERCARLAASTPVYRLEIARDLARVGEVVAEIVGWHGPRPEAGS